MDEPLALFPEQHLGRRLLDEMCEKLKADAGKIRHCTDQLTDEQTWWRPATSMNSIGNLLLHLCGNLRQWVLSGIGGHSDVRDRAAEFAERGPIPRSQLLANLDQTLRDVTMLLNRLPVGRLDENLCIQGFDVTVLRAILHCVTHFTGHTQEIIHLTREQLGESYRFAWTP